jgi:hypothetical protein
LLAICVGLMGTGVGRTGEPDKTKLPDPAAVKKLVADLDSADGRVRTAATKKLFAYGKAVLPELKKAGAKQVAPSGGTVDGTRRLDAVYSLLEGLPPNPPGARAGYRTNSFGLHLVPGTSVEDVARIGQKYGFTVGGSFHPDGRPNAYVKLAPGKSLAEVLKRLLAEEQSVTTINLNYFEG